MRAFEADEVEMFFETNALLRREGGFTHADIMGMTRQERVDQLHALAQVLRGGSKR